MRLTRTVIAGIAGAVAIAAAAVAPMATGAAAPTVTAVTPTTGSASATLPTKGLNILLGDDDGWNAYGISAVYSALVAAGHHVTMSAPESNFSGSSAAVAFGGTVNIKRHTDAEVGDNAKWSVSGTPVTSIIYGITSLYPAGEKPDLVVSGANVGSNTGFDTNFSGTIGVATVASGMYGIPAIAISTATNYGQESAAAYAETADFLVDLIARGVPTLPRGEFININYPLLSAERPAPLGVKYASLSPASAAAFSFSKANDDPDDSVYNIIPARGSEAHPAGSDAQLLSEGYVTVGVLDADRSVPATGARAVANLVRQIDRDSGQHGVHKPSVGKLPRVVLKGTSQWVRARNLDGVTVTVTWTPVNAKKGKSMTTAVKVKGNLIRFTAPKQRAVYKVAVKSGAKTLRQGTVKVV